MSKGFVAAACVAGGLFVCAPASATFHFMQIEQVIAGVNGDTSAQAIQLRMRNSFPQNQVAGTELIAWDANGQNPVVLLTFPSNVANGALGTRILVATASFADNTDPPAEADFILTNPIPESYLAAGSLTFEADFLPGNIVWRLSWGGDAYTGPHNGTTFNDADGNFGPAFPGGLPVSSLQALQFTGSASALSTNNAAQYQVTAGAATFINNDGDSFTVVGGKVECPADLNDSGAVNAADLALLLGAWGPCDDPCPAADLNDSGGVNAADLALLLGAWGDCKS